MLRGIKQLASGIPMLEGTRLSPVGIGKAAPEEAKCIALCIAFEIKASASPDAGSSVL
jgi:hypothetical protein